jgi:hypothetical protein
MFYGKFTNPVDNPNIYNVDGDNRLSISLQLEVYLKSMFQSGSVIVFPIPEIILLSTIKQNSQVLIIFE